MKTLELQDLKGKRVKITYNSMNTEVSRDEGILNNINLEISGQSSINIIPIPFMIFSTVFETNEIVNVHMDSAWITLTTTDEYVSIVAFAKTISWEWK